MGLIRKQQSEWQWPVDKKTMIKVTQHFTAAEQSLWVNKRTLCVNTHPPRLKVCLCFIILLSTHDCHRSISTPTETERWKWEKEKEDNIKDSGRRPIQKDPLKCWCGTSWDISLWFIIKLNFNSDAFSSCLPSTWPLRWLWQILAIKSKSAQHVSFEILKGLIMMDYVC